MFQKIIFLKCKWKKSTTKWKKKKSHQLPIKIEMDTAWDLLHVIYH